MRSRAEDVNTVEPDPHGGFSAMVASHPWWRGPGFGGVPPVVLPENGSKPGASMDLLIGSGAMKGVQSQSQSQIHGDVDGVDGGSKEMQSMVERADGRYGQEHHQLQSLSSNMPPMMPEYLTPRIQMELGQSAGCAAYTYPDPYFTGIMNPYGSQAMVHPQLPGIPHTRMPLPLEMAEEPVYVNAKQYHGILRRRQSRAKLELEKKLIKSRKPYLHESRHQHAMRRARGCGGRFTKKDANYANPDTENVSNLGTSHPTRSSSSTSADTLHSGNHGNQDPTSTLLEVGRSQGMFEQSTNNGSYQERSGFQFSVFHHSAGERAEEGDCMGQQRGSMLVSRPPNRAVAIK